MPSRSTTAAVPAKKAATPGVSLSADVAEAIRPGQSIELLKELHILTRDARLNQDSRRKLKQVYHLYNFIEPLLQEIVSEHADVTLVDHGAGSGDAYRAGIAVIVGWTLIGVIGALRLTETRCRNVWTADGVKAG